MKDRLQRFLDLEQLTPARLADILGIQRSGLSHILSGRNKPGFDLIQKLLTKFPSLNADWLITGKGKVYKESSPSHDTSVSSTLFANIEKNIEEVTLRNPSLSPEVKEINSSLGTSQLYENSINQSIDRSDQEKRSLRKIIMIYSDNSFVEYHPGKE
ncbi:MAG: helix-turn-helix transcriptional regulator [Bacteroidales bacterium]|nr:helix-turn-helix transcriptional regulator [Bacteroidales bacterium]